MISKIITKNDYTSEFMKSTTPLALGELAYDHFNHILKIGDGTSLWTELPVLGEYSDGGVIAGEFSGNNQPTVSINVGTSEAKRIYIACMPEDATDAPKGSILSLYCDFVSDEKGIVYQGMDAHRIGRYKEGNFTFTHKETTTSSDKTEHIYDIGFYSASNPTYANFLSGAQYKWFAVTKEPVTGGSGSSGTENYSSSVSGSFIGAGTPKQKIYVGNNEAAKVYITCTPQEAAEKTTGSILSLYYDVATGDANITYQGATESLIGHYGATNMFYEFDGNGYLTVGFYSSGNPNYANFINGVEYNWLVVLAGNYNAPSDSTTILSNGTYDIAEYASAVVNVPTTTTTSGICDCTQYKAGILEVDTDTLISSISITDIGFKPKVFLLRIGGGIVTTTKNKNYMTSTWFMTNNSGTLLSSTVNGSSHPATCNEFAYYTGTAAQLSVSNSSKHCLTPTSNGVTGSGTSSIYLKSGLAYYWYALG